MTRRNKNRGKELSADSDEFVPKSKPEIVNIEFIPLAPLPDVASDNCLSQFEQECKMRSECHAQMQLFNIVLPPYNLFTVGNVGNHFEDTTYSSLFHIDRIPDTKVNRVKINDTYGTIAHLSMDNSST